MKTYTITPASDRVPSVVVDAADEFHLGHLAAGHLIRHKLLRPGLVYDAQLGSGRGLLTQHGLPKPVAFTYEEVAR